MKKYLSLFSVSALFFSLAAYAADAVPAPSFGDAIVALLSAYKTHAGVAAIIVAVVQLLKSDVVGGLLLKINQKWVPILLLAITGIGGTAQAVLTGKNWWQGAVDGFITSGIAMSIYEAAKSIRKA